MRITNNTDAPQVRKLNWKHLLLVVLHFVVFLLSAFSGEFTTTEATAGTLP